MNAVETTRPSFARRPGFACALAVIGTLALYWKVLGYPFIVFQDPEYVTANPRLQSGLTPGGMVWAFTSFHAGSWHPVTWISHMLDVSLFGRISMGPHLVNLLLHAANVGLLFWICLKLFAFYQNGSPALAIKSGGADKPGGRCGGAFASAANIAGAFFVAAVFGWHPVHVESVAWVSARKDVLSALFALLSIWSYLKVWDRPAAGAQVGSDQSLHFAAPTQGRFPLKWPLVFFALAVLAGPMLVTLPVLLLLLDYWPLGRMANAEGRIIKERTRPLILEKWPFWILSLLCVIMTILAGQKSGALAYVGQLSLGTRATGALVAYAAYLGKIFWPASLAIPYLHPGGFGVGAVAASGFLIVGLTVVLGVLRRNPPYVRVGWLWFLIMLIPVSGLMQVGGQWMADRYLYLPMVGILLPLALAFLVAKPNSPKTAIVTILPGAAVLIASACATSRQLNYWRDSATLFAHTLSIEPHNYLARNYYGMSLYERGDVDGAIREYRMVLESQPKDAPTLDNLGTALTAKGDQAGALAAYQAAVAANPNSADAHNNLGVLLARAGRSDDAMKQYSASLAVEPDNPEAHCNIANLLVAQNKASQAVREYYAALDANPNYLPALNNLGYVLGMNESLKLATNIYARALRLDPTNAQTHCNFGDVLVKNRQYTSAFNHYKLALQYNPNLPDAYEGLGVLVLTRGNTNEAKMYLGKALQLNPGNSDLRARLEALVGTAGLNSNQPSP